MSSNAKFIKSSQLEEIVRKIVKHLIKEGSLPLPAATVRLSVYPQNFKSVPNYIRIRRKVETDEWVVAWFANGKFDDNKSYYTNDIGDAYDTFKYMQKQVDEANALAQSSTTESVAGDNFTKFARSIALDSAKFKLVLFKDIPIGSSFKAGAFAPYYDYIKTNDASAEGTDGKKKWISNFSPDNKVAVLSQPPVAEMTGTGAVSGVATPFAFKRKTFNENEFDGFKYPKHNAKVSDAEMEEAKNVAHRIWQPVYLTRFHSTGLNGYPKWFEVRLHSSTGDRYFIYKDKTGKWFYQQGTGVDAKYVPADEYLTEMTVTGDVSGYNIPGAFAKKGGSAKGIAGSAALGYKLTPMGEKEMERRADKLMESQQAALGKKFSKAQRSYDAQSEPEEKRERNCAEDGHDWTVKGSGKSAFRKCDCCGKTVHPGESED